MALIDKLHENSSWSSRTHLQKTLFFVQTLLEIDVGFEFRLHRHGPYSHGLTRTLQQLEKDETLSLISQAPRYGPRITTTASADHLREAHPEVLTEFDVALDFVAQRFGGCDVKELERLSTALWFHHADPAASPAEVAREVCAIKPHISRADALAAYDRVCSLAKEAADLGLVTSGKLGATRRDARSVAPLRPTPVGSVAAVNTHTVFVAHGRDLLARSAVVDLLYTVGLKPESMPQASRYANHGTPFSLTAIEAAMEAAQAIVLVLAPEEDVSLVERLAGGGSVEHGLQPRPNVYVELGMALRINRGATIVVEMGAIRPATNLDGLNVVRYDGTHSKRSELLRRLEAAGCPVDWSTEWAEAGADELRQIL